MQSDCQRPLARQAGPDEEQAYQITYTAAPRDLTYESEIVRRWWKQTVMEISSRIDVQVKYQSPPFTVPKKIHRDHASRQENISDAAIPLPKGALGNEKAKMVKNYQKIETYNFRRGVIRRRRRGFAVGLCRMRWPIVPNSANGAGDTFLKLDTR